MNIHFLICIVIFIAMVLGFLQSKVSKTVVALAAMIALVVTGCLEPKAALSGFSNSNTVLMAAMFVVSEGLSRTQAVYKVSSMVHKISHGSFTMILAGYVFTTMILAQISGGSSVFAIMFPVIFALCDNLGYCRSKMMFPVGMVSIATCAVIPIGSAASTYAQYNGFLESNGAVGYHLSLWDPMIARLPSLIAICLYAILIAPKFCPELPPVIIDGDKNKKGKENHKLDPFHELMGYGTFILVMIGMLLSDTLGIPTWVITLAGALLICATGVLTAKEAYEAASLGGIVMMYVGILAMGNALTATGAGEAIGGVIANAIGDTRNGYVIGGVFFIVPFILTQFMNNRAVANIFAPIAVLTCNAIGCNPIGPMLLTLSGALTSFITPMACATNNMVMGLGGYSQKSVLKMSILPALLLIVVNVFWVMTVYPAF